MADIRPITIIAGKLKELPVADRLLVDSMLSNGPINIIGSSNVTQLLVKGNASQTTKLISLTDSSDAEKLSFDGIGNMYLENTTFANQEGVIYKNGERFLHNFNYGDNGTVTTQARNLFIGALAGNFTMGSTATVISQSSFNIGIGEESMRYNETGYNNSAIGFATLRMNTSGQGNLAIAANSLRNNLTGNYNVGIGGDALYNNLSGNSNVAIGSGAMRGNLTGGSNIAIGYNTLIALQSGVNNTAIGNSAAIGAVSSSSVTAVGSLALRLNTGDSNTAIGASALQKSTTGIGLTAVGTLALFELTTGQFNTAIGTSAIRGITTTDSNIGIGRNAGWKITGGVTDNSTPSESIFIGDSTVALANGQTNQIVIGYGAAGIGSNSVVIGNDFILTTALKGNVGIGTTTPQGKIDVTGTANELQLLVKGNATQTANLQEWQTSIGTQIGYFNTNGTFYSAGGRISAISTKTSNYAALASDYSIVIDATSNTVEILLPASPTTGQTYNIACINSTFVATVNFNGKNFYDSSNDEIISKGDEIRLQYNGVEWIGSYSFGEVVEQWVAAPLTNSSTGIKGQLAMGTIGGILYKFTCYATNQWSKVAQISSFDDTP